MITELEYKILIETILDENKIEAKNVKNLFKQKVVPQTVSRVLASMKNKKLLVAIGGDKKRKYKVNFVDNVLLRGIMKQLDKEGFLPDNEHYLDK